MVKFLNLNPAATDVTAAGKVLTNFLISRPNCNHPTESYRNLSASTCGYGALRIEVEENGLLWMPAAGMPWFVAVFGRDSIMQAMCYEFGRGTLVKLAQLQATEVNWHSHEIRQGELAFNTLLRDSRSHYSLDYHLSEAYRWNTDFSMLNDCQVPLERALAWIDQYGDFDGDGFVEYVTRSQQGLRNQGWKDSGLYSLPGW